MRSPLTRSLRLPAVALVAALALTACGDDPADKAPPAAEAVPSAVAPAVGSDVGQFLVTPKEGTSKTLVDGTVAKLKGMSGVQSVTLTPEGALDVVLKPGIPQSEREDVVKQMAALGEVIEGI